MRPTALFLVTASLLLASVVYAGDSSSDANQFWPQWRGPLTTGAAPLADPPVSWSETEHVKWKVKIPGSGDSTPIVWGNRIFVLTAIPMGKKTKAPESPAATAGTAAATPQGDRGRMNSEAPDEAYQFAVLCLDRNTGKILWQKTAREEVPHEGHQQNNTFASGSAVTDGQLVLAFF